VLPNSPLDKREETKLLYSDFFKNQHSNTASFAVDNLQRPLTSFLPPVPASPFLTTDSYQLRRRLGWGIWRSLWFSIRATASSRCGGGALRHDIPAGSKSRMLEWQ